MTDSYEVLITSEAAADLYDLHNYIAVRLRSPKAASEHMEALKGVIERLSVMPFRHALVDDEQWRARGVRRVTVKNFIVYYRVDKPAARVYVIAVIYGRRDQLKALGGT